MYLHRVEFEGGQESYDLAFRPGLNVIVATSKAREKLLLECLCAALSLNAENTDSTIARMRIEFLDENNQRYCCDLSEERERVIYKLADDSSRPTMSSITTDTIDKQFTSLTPILLRTIAGLTDMESSQERDREVITDETIKAWEYERQAVQRKYNELKELELQLEMLEPDLELADRIARLPGELKQRLDNAPSLLNQFENRENQISKAKDDVFLAIAADSGVRFDPAVGYAFVGMILSFVVAEIIDFPIIALLNIFFAVFIANRLFQNIEQLESTARVNARGRAVADAETRVARKRTQTGSDLDAVSDSLGTDIESISRVMSMSGETTQQAERLREEIDTLGEGASSSDILEQLDALSAKIAIAHQKRISQEPSSEETTLEGHKYVQRLDQDLFHELTQGEATSVSRDEFENEILDPLMKLSEGRYDGATLSEEGRLTVVGPDDVFPVSFTKFGDTDKILIETAVRLGAMKAVLNSGTQSPFAMTDRFARQSDTRRIRFREAMESIANQTQIVVVSSTSAWSDANVIEF